MKGQNHHGISENPRNRRLQPRSISSATANGPATPDAGVIESINPADGKLIASIYGASAADYERVVGHRPLGILKPGEASLRHSAAKPSVCAPTPCAGYKDALGSLVSLEMGKIKAEGDGEVQEMIDIGGLRPGPVTHVVRPHDALGKATTPHVRTMASFRDRVGVISSFQLPGRGMVLERRSLPPFAATSRSGNRRRNAHCAASPCRMICNEALEEGGFPPIFLSFMASGHDLANRFCR